MRLSQALKDGHVKFEIRSNPAGGKEYVPFGGCVSKAFPENNPADVFPLAFGCPLFMGTTGPAKGSVATRIVDVNLPPGSKFPYRDAILFLCDAIDCMAVKLGMTEMQVAEVVEHIEAAFEWRGLDWNGRP
jgi:hypothetical protein